MGTLLRFGKNAVLAAGALAMMATARLIAIDHAISESSVSQPSSQTARPSRARAIGNDLHWEKVDGGIYQEQLPIGTILKLSESIGAIVLPIGHSSASVSRNGFVCAFSTKPQASASSQRIIPKNAEFEVTGYIQHAMSPVTFLVKPAGPTRADFVESIHCRKANENQPGSVQEMAQLLVAWQRVNFNGIPLHPFNTEFFAHDRGRPTLDRNGRPQFFHGGDGKRHLLTDQNRALWRSSAVRYVPQVKQDSKRMVGFELDELRQAALEQYKDPGNNYGDSMDFCWLRAQHMADHLMARLAAKGGDLWGADKKPGTKDDPIKKIIIRYPVAHHWKYHIAVCAKTTDGKEVVVDPIDGVVEPYSIGGWLKRFCENLTPIPVKLENPEKEKIPNENCYYEIGPVLRYHMKAVAKSYEDLRWAAGGERARLLDYIHRSIGRGEQPYPIRDEDNDGIPDSIDKSPGTSAGVRVDFEGKPVSAAEATGRE